MTTEQIKELMDKEIITQVVNPTELAKLSDEDIIAKFVGQYGYGVNLVDDVLEESIMEEEIVEPETEQETEIDTEVQNDEPVVEETEE